jgi:predicted transglutaminase-like cysteine proteinase
MSPSADAMAKGLNMIATRLATSKQAVFAVTALWSVMFTGSEALADVAFASNRLSLPVVNVVERYPPYADFCRRYPNECDLSGRSVLLHSTDLMDMIRVTNVTVNLEIKFMLDISQYNAEEYWALPTSGYGDCEDLALEKRSRLVKAGVASGALRLAFVFHRRLLNSHCVLTVETSEGTYVLDSYTDDVSRWDQVPYNFEARERTDGLWDRFDQIDWSYQH